VRKNTIALKRSGWWILKSVLLLTSYCSSLGSLAQEREYSLDHAGSVGFIVGVGPEYSGSIKADCLFCLGEQTLVDVSGVFDIGATVAINQEGDEIVLRGRLVRLSSSNGESLLLGYRKYFGREEIKTFASLDLQTTFRPVKTMGVRGSFGVMYDFSPILGIWLDGGGSFGFGYGRRFGLETTIGMQARSYLFE
jgi:hypothetical protein